MSGCDECIARALFAYDNDGRHTYDDADHDERSPYLDLAGIARGVECDHPESEAAAA